MNQLVERVAKQVIKMASWNWEPHSRLILYGENSGWSLDWDIRELGRIVRRLGVRIVNPLWKHALQPQSIFFASQFFW